MQIVGLGQQLDILFCVFAFKATARPRSHGNATIEPIASHEACHLRIRVSGHAHHVLLDDVLFFLTLFEVLELLKSPVHPPVFFFAGDAFELDELGPIQKLLERRDRFHGRVVHCDRHNLRL